MTDIKWLTETFEDEDKCIDRKEPLSHLSRVP